MEATTEVIRRWLTRGKEQGATHVIIWSDDFHDFAGEYFPDYVMPGQDVRAIEQASNGKDMQRVVEIYNLALPIEEQLQEFRAWHY